MPIPTGLHGQLQLLCALDDRGWSSLQRQSVQAPFHISKPHRDQNVLVVNLANPTAGFLTGDRAECHVEVAAGAALCLTTPAANRAFRMREGGRAELSQRFTIAAGGWLEFLPEPFIPQAGTHFRQRTVIEAEPGAEAIFFECLAPGRTASGEAFAFAELRWETDLRLASRPIARERYTLTPSSAAVASLRAQFPEAYYASCFVLTGRLPTDAPCWRELEALQSSDLWLGGSALVQGGYVIKMLARGPIPLRAGVAAVRARLHAALGRAVPDLRRTVPVG